MLNKVLMIGNITRDPEELRYLESGTAVIKFGIASNRKFKDKEYTTFVDVTAFGGTAEFVSKYLAKGRQVLLEGRLDLDQWEDKDSGQKRSKLYVTAESVSFVGPKPKDAGDSESQSVDAGVGDVPF